MKSPVDVEKEFFEKYLVEKQKISLNLGKQTIKNIDELASIIGITRTGLIETLCRVGMVEQLKVMKETYEKMLKMKEYQSKKNIITQKINKLNEFGKKINK